MISAIPYRLSRPFNGRIGRINLGDRVFRSITMFFALSLIVLVSLIGYELVSSSMPSIRQFGWRFLVESTWDPVLERFGALPLIYGTLVSSCVALILAVPLSLGTAIYLTDLAPLWLRQPIAFLVDLLAAIPSVVYGLWGVFVLAPWLRTTLEPFLAKTLGFLPFFQGPMYGVGMLAAGMILAVMVIPFISSVSREVLLAVPSTQREAALALGATRWEATRMAVLRYGWSGLIGAVLLGLGRALGETMAVTMVIGNRHGIDLSFFAPGYTMASAIANEFSEATTDLYVSALIEVGLVLFCLTIIINLAARLLVWRVSRGATMAPGR